MLASLTPSTLKQYEAPLRDWWHFCHSSTLDAFKPTDTDVLDFLSNKYKDGASYSSLNTARSAVSLIAKTNIGQSALISRFFKGIFKLRPTKPRYHKIWNTEPVLKKVAEIHPVESLSLEEITQKLVILLAIGTAHRVQSLSLIELDGIIESPSGLDVRIEKPIKTTKAGTIQPNFFIPFFHQKPELCLASTIKSYIDKTKDLRGNVKNLIICTKKPFRAANTQTISRWIRAFLCKAGVSNEYSAHSTRHASTSAALKKGLDVNIIKSTAGWSENSLTFARFYNRPIETDRGQYINTVLNIN